jgi:hypothetical protein
MFESLPERDQKFAHLICIDWPLPISQWIGMAIRLWGSSRLPTC